MQFFLTEVKAQNQAGTMVQLSMNPEKVTLNTGIITQDYTIMQLGEVSIPYGNKLTSISWDGKFPGFSRYYMSYVSPSWEEPNVLHCIFRSWQQTGTKVHLLITDTPINMDVFIDSYDAVWSGGCGDIDYSITLKQYRELKIYKSTENANTGGSWRTDRPLPHTYKVKYGDSLWKIAQQQLGDGSKYTDIYEINKEIIGNDPLRLNVGQVLTLPY